MIVSLAGPGFVLLGVTVLRAHRWSGSRWFVSAIGGCMFAVFLPVVITSPPTRPSHPPFRVWPCNASRLPPGAVRSGRFIDAVPHEPQRVWAERWLTIQ